MGFLNELMPRSIQFASPQFIFLLPVERFKKLMMTGGEDETSEHVPQWMFLYFFLSVPPLGQFEFTFWQTHQFCRYEAREGQKGCERWRGVKSAAFGHWLGHVLLARLLSFECGLGNHWFSSHSNDFKGSFAVCDLFVPETLIPSIVSAVLGI